MLLLQAIGVALVVFGGILLTKPSLVALKRLGVKVSVPAGILVLILGAAMTVFPHSDYYKLPTNGPTSTPPAAATAFPMTPSTAPTPIAITSPSNDSEVHGVFSVTGTAPDLGQDKLWLMVWSENATYPGKVYYRTTREALTVANGTWTVSIGPLGPEGEEIGEIFQLKLVRANPTCSDSILHAVPNPADEIVFPMLPAGCTDAAGPISVKKGP